MSDTSSAIATNLARGQEHVSMSILKSDAKAQQALADMITQNSRQIEVLSQNYSGGSIDISV